MSASLRLLARLAGLALAVAAAGPVRAEPFSAAASVKAAREAAHRDRHQESIEHFRRAIEGDPERRTEWLPELADQLTWSGHAGDAVPLYRESLANASTPEQQRSARLGLALALSWDDQLGESLAEYDALIAQDPADREARLGRARVLSWLDRQGPARDEYARVLADHPGDLEARRGLGRVQSWRGRQRDAAERMQALLADHPHDRQATHTLAESLDWMGRPDRAEHALREQVAADPGDARSAQLLDEIEFDQRPRSDVDWFMSHQSNDLRITATSLEHSFFLNDGRTRVGPLYALGVFQPDDGPTDEILVNRPGVHASHRFDDAWAWSGRFNVDVIDTRGASGDHVRPTYDTFVSFAPNDTLRFDLGSSRSIFDNEVSLREGISAVYGNLSMDVTPDELTRITPRVSYGDYSDGNRRAWWQLEGERRVWHHPRISTGLRYTGFDFAKQRNNGYFNPNHYHSNEVLLRAWDDLGERVRWFVGGTVGYEIQTPGSGKVIWSAGTNLAYELTRRVEVEAGYHFFSSRTAGTSGFERGTGSLQLRHTW
jgi:tetratricopeptide (TPR) repeat protein